MTVSVVVRIINNHESWYFRVDDCQDMGHTPISAYISLANGVDL